MNLMLGGGARKRIWSRWAQAKPVPSYEMERARSDVAGTAGLEPTISESKSGVLPLHYVPPYKVKGLGLLPIPFIMGWVKGLEPSTPGTTIRCSNQLSYTHHIYQPHGISDKNGTPEGTRTPGLLLRRQLLYPTELLAQIYKLERVTGIEPASPAWKAGALAIVLHPHRTSPYPP